MASVRYQIGDAIEAKLAAVLIDLSWKTVIRDPREAVDEDQMNAIVMATGGEPEPDSLTGHVGTYEAEFEIGLVVLETSDATAEELLDQGFVAVCDTLLDPDDIQLGGLAISIQRGGMSPPIIGRGRNDEGSTAARIVGVQDISFSVSYWAREGDAAAPGP